MSPVVMRGVETVRDTIELGDFSTERGERIPGTTIAYETFGHLSTDRSNAVLVEHALTGDAHVTAGDTGDPGWWEDVVGPGKPIDTREFFVVCTNVIGGCAGSTGPTTALPDVHGARFPNVSVRDMARAEAQVADHLGIERFHAVIGGSLGGARAAEFALTFPGRVSKAMVLAAPAYSSADNIAWAHTQLQAIELDPNYHSGNYEAYGVQPLWGLGLARQIAHLTYRSGAELDVRFGRSLQTPGTDYYQVQSYLDYQAGKLVDRFDAQSYCVLTRALANHDIRASRDSLPGGEFHVVSLSSDRLYPPEQVLELAGLVNARSYTEISTHVGHDGFLTETQAVGAVIEKYLY